VSLPGTKRQSNLSILLTDAIFILSEALKLQNFFGGKNEVRN
jgi:hypothetical protein